MINLSSAASTRPPHAYPAFPTPDQMLPCLASKVMAQKHRLRSLRTVGMQVQGCSVLLKSIEVSPWYLAANAGLLAEVLMAEAHAPCVGALAASRPLRVSRNLTTEEGA